MKGLSYFFVGLGLLTKPGVRGYVIVPLLINLLLFSVLIYWGFAQLSEWVTWVTDWLPSWLDFLGWLMWAILALLTLVVLVIGFNILANIIAAPFNAFLSAAVQARLLGESPPESGRSLPQEALHTIGREFHKLGFYLPRAMALLALGFFPLFTPLLPFIWLLFNGWMMSLQYLDYPFDNNGKSFQQALSWMRANRIGAIGFGFIVMLVAMTPLLNFVLIPASVAGATAFWVSENKR